MFESLLLLNHLRYQNMNGNMLSHICLCHVLSQLSLNKSSQNVSKKSQKWFFAQFTTYMCSDDSDLDCISTISLASCYTLESFKLFKFFKRFNFHYLKLSTKYYTYPVFFIADQFWGNNNGAAASLQRLRSWHKYTWTHFYSPDTAVSSKKSLLGTDFHLCPDLCRTTTQYFSNMYV